MVWWLAPTLNVTVVGVQKREKKNLLAWSSVKPQEVWKEKKQEAKDLYLEVVWPGTRWHTLDSGVDVT